MGSGKSAVGAAVAARAGAAFNDLDRMIEERAGMPISGIFATQGEAAFRDLERRLLPEALQPGTVVALGGGAVIDDASWRLVAAEAVTVYLDVAFDTIWERIHAWGGRPLIAGRSHDEVESLFEQRRPRYLEAAYRVKGDRAIERVVDEVLQIWSA